MCSITEISGPANWKSRDLYNDKSWVYRLTDKDVKEIDSALYQMKMNSLDYVVPETYFPIPNLAKKLCQISDYIEHNKGIFLLRGLPVERYSHNDIRLIFSGIGAYLGTSVRQSIEGELIYDVMDKGKSLTDKSSRGTATKDPLPFHTDRCDVVALLCLRKSKSGGQSRVVSSVAIHNEILRRRPELLQILYEPYYHARTAWETGEKSSYYPLPIFTQYKGYFATRYLRHFINVAQQISDIPKMTEDQIEALNLLESIATDPKFCADMEFEVGDIQFLNNFVSLHSRSGYEDHDDPSLKRHLFRLWLSVPNSRPLSPSFLPLYHKVGAGQIRGGVSEIIKMSNVA